MDDNKELEQEVMPKAESKKQKAEVKEVKELEVVTGKYVTVEYLKGSQYAGSTKKMLLAIAKKLEKSGKVRIIKG